MVSRLSNINTRATDTIASPIWNTLLTHELHLEIRIAVHDKVGRGNVGFAPAAFSSFPITEAFPYEGYALDLEQGRLRSEIYWEGVRTSSLCLEQENTGESYNLTFT